ncbi:hypothetical protein M0R45_036038 [Rubus argutus]|uniref:Uncharacterized protein n=1 Tax=Rubus argutus TaxID=59490 RepID=A0AAW1VWE6_RUBAR
MNRRRRSAVKPSCPVPTAMPSHADSSADADDDSNPSTQTRTAVTDAASPNHEPSRIAYFCPCSSQQRVL